MDEDKRFDRYFSILAAVVVTVIVICFIAGCVIGIHFLAKVW